MCYRDPESSDNQAFIKTFYFCFSEQCLKRGKGEKAVGGIAVEEEAIKETGKKENVKRWRHSNTEGMFPCGFLTSPCDKLHRDSMFKHY